MTDNGRVLTETGSRPTGQAPTGLDAPRIDPARWWAALGKEAATDIPYVMQIGRYAFFAVCAFGFGVVVSLPMLSVVSKDAAHTIANVASLAAFLALRDMSKPWDVARKAAAKAMEDQKEGSNG